MKFNQDIFDAVISNQLDVMRLTAHQRAKVLKQLAAMEKELSEALASNDLGKLNRRQVERFLKQTDKIIGSHYGEITTSLELEDTAEAVGHNAARTLEIVLAVDVVELPADYIASVMSDVLIQGAPNADWWKAQAADTAMKFKTQVRQGVLAAETNQQIIQRIVGKNGQAGVMDIVKRNASSLVQTSVQTIANDARRATYQANSDVISGLRQVSTLDSHTSLICTAYSDAQWNLDYEPINGTTLLFNGGTPRHWGCRSTEVPITKTFKELGIDIKEAPIATRASADGQIKADTSFDAFLKRMGKDFQDEQLGHGRAELWRKGKLTLRDLLDLNGKPLSLAQLQVKYGMKK